MIRDLSGQWRFDVAGTIDVPGFWEAAGHLALDGQVQYEREVVLDEAPTVATLEFDAVADVCQVFVNGAYVGEHDVGFTPFALDVSGHLRAGVNTIVIGVYDPPLGSEPHLDSISGKQGWGNNVFPSPPSLYLTYGGIWQPCRLVVHGPLYVDDVWFREPDVTVGVVNRSGSAVHDTVVVEAFGQRRWVDVEVAPGERAEVRVTFDMSDVPRWSQASPVLHTVTAVVDGHVRSITTGVRRIERTDDDVLIDGVPYRMRSALHQGFWPRRLYAADPELIERDIELALDAGLNTLRCHLKAFEPAWLDAADRMGLFLHCDLPMGEPVRPEAFGPDTVFGRRCLLALEEQIRRDRSRPSIVAWSLMNEVGLSHPGLVTSEGYRELMAAMVRRARELDPDRVIIENDWVVAPDDLVTSDARSPHWYGRATDHFLRQLDDKIAAAEAEPGLLYVTEFGEWGLPATENGDAFWDNESDIAALVAKAGWRRSYDEFAVATQTLQGWADRIQAERLRTSPVVKGFCLTEWTDVPHELNGLVSLRREPKAASIDAFRPALADVADVLLFDRFTFACGETVDVASVRSDWSSGAPPSRSSVSLTMPSSPGRHVVDGYPVLTLSESDASDALESAKVVSEDSITSEAEARAIEEEAADGQRIVVLAQREWVPGFGRVEKMPLGWGPTPFLFTTDAVGPLPADAVLGPEVFHCFPTRYLPDVTGPVGLVLAPPFARTGAVVARTGNITVCLLRIGSGLAAGRPYERSLLEALAIPG